MKYNELKEGYLLKSIGSKKYVDLIIELSRDKYGNYCVYTLESQGIRTLWSRSTDANAEISFSNEWYIL